MMMFKVHGFVKAEGAVAVGCSDFVRLVIMEWIVPEKPKDTTLPTYN
jgi:hypothetical protein